MKKNITLNLCGRLFNIDEDAYEMLSTYEQSLRNYFRSREGGEEIADDIEARIAELMDELKAQGTEAITIEHVTEIIHRLGKPEEMDGLTPDPSPDGEGKSNKNENPTASHFINERGGKRLYRDPYDKKLSGVLSGFAAYFGGDVLWWRIGYVGAILLCFFGSNFNLLWWLPGHRFFFNIHFWGFGLIIAYIVLSILMPVAWSPEERLRMKGKPVNPQNLAEEVSHPQTVQEPTEGLRGCFYMVGTFFRWCVYAFGMFIAVMCLVGMVWIAVDAIFHYNLFPDNNPFLKSEEHAEFLSQYAVLINMSIISFFILMGTTAYSIIHSLLNEFKQVPAMSYRQRFIILATWIVALAVTGCTLAYLVPKFDDAERVYHKMQDLHENGTYYSVADAKYMDENGWDVRYAVRCNGNLTSVGEYMLNPNDCPDHKEVRYFHSYDPLHRQKLCIERTEHLQPGIYRLTCAARANGTGAFVYARIDCQEPILKEIPANGNVGGDIWEEANEFLQNHKNKKIDADSTTYANRLCKLWSVNNNQGYGWNRIIIEPITITEPTTLSYGLTSDNDITHHTWLGQWFSATDFELTLVEEAKMPVSEEQHQDSSEVHRSRMVTVRKGETLASIAKRNHTTVRELCRLNHLKPDSPLHSGQRLRVRPSL